MLATGSTGTLTADNVENAAGGTAADVFNFTDAATLSGGVSGGAGSDTLDLSDHDPLTDAELNTTLTGVDADNGFAGTVETGVVVSTVTDFSGIDVLVGSDDAGVTDTLTGQNADSFVAVDGANRGIYDDDQGTTAAELDFSDVEALVGGNQADTFDITADFGAPISGGAGDDVFNFNGGDATTVSGEDGDDSFNLVDATEVVDATLDGGEGAETAGDTVGGLAAAGNTFTVNSDDNVTVLATGSTGTLTADNVENASGGGAVDVFNMNAGLNGTVDGNGGSDEIIGVATANIFIVDGPDSGTVNGTDFQEVENLTGGADLDQFTFTAALSGTASGEGNDDTFNINDNGDDNQSIDGGADTDTVTYAARTSAVTVSYGAFTDVELLVGSPQVDTLQGTAGADVFTVDNLNEGFVGGIDFSSFESLEGLDGNDQFNMDAGLDGTVDGDDGTDEIIGLAAAPNTFVINGQDSGTVNGTDFQEVENLTGGGTTDTFTFTADLSGTASGVGGNDTFNINNGGSVNQSINGGSGNDTVTFAAQSSGVTVPFGAFASIETLIGSGQSDTLQGTSAANTFNVSGTNSGSVSGINFSSFESIAALGGNDTFNMNGALSGVASGGTGSDEIVGTSGADTFTVSSTNAGSVNGTSFTSVENLTGGDSGDTFNMNAGLSGTVAGSAGSDEIVGSASANAFSVTGANAGSVNGTSFTSIENLTGGAAGDTFSFSGALSGTAAGAEGNDTFSLNAGGDAGLLVGNSGNDLIVGTSSANTFVVNAANAGTANGISFNTIENLTGGAAADEFTFNASISGTAAGSGGDDTFNLSGGGAGNIDGGANGDEIVGSGSANTFVVNAPNAGTVNNSSFINVENLTGGAAGDTFNMNADLSGTVDGGAGSDEIVGAASANTFAVNAMNAGTVNGTDFTNIENLTGGAAADEFTFAASLTGTADGAEEDDIFNLEPGGGAGTIDGGANGANGDVIVGSAAANTFVVNATDAGTANGSSFTNVENLTGGADSDTFNMNADLSGTVDGGAGSDEIVGAATANTFVVSAADAGTVNGTSFDNVENLTGGVAADGFTFTADLTGTAAGGDSDDTFAFEGGSAALASGGAGNDTFDVTSSGFAGTAQGGAGNDLFDVDTSTSADLLGGDGDDTFSIADNVVASGMVDGEAGAADTLDLSEYSSSRSVTLVAADADGYDGTEASVSNGFANINSVEGSAAGSGDSLTGLDAEATWQIVGNSGNVYSSNPDLVFGGFEVLAGGADVDTFALGGGSVTGDLGVEGNGGSDVVTVVADFDVSNDLSISGVESVTSDAGATLGANDLSIAGATGGIGTAGDPLQTDIGSLQISGSGDVYLDEANALDITGIGSSGDVAVTATGAVTQTGDVTTQGGAIDLTASDIMMNDGTAATSCAGGCTTAGNISYATTGGGDLIVGLLDAGDPSADSDLSPNAGNSGTVTLTSTNGSILNGNAVGADNVRGGRAILDAPSGRIGTSSSPIRVIVPLIQGTTTITVSSSLGAVIDNPNLAEVNAQAGNVIEPVKIGVSTAVGASVLSALEEIGYVDWAGLDPNVRLVDCLEPCIKLPPDQLEDDGLAGLREPTQMLVIPTIDGVKLIPVYVETIARTSWDIGEAGP